MFSGCFLLTSPGKSKRAPESNLQVCSDLESMSQRNTYIKYWDILLRMTSVYTSKAFFYYYYLVIVTQRQENFHKFETASVYTVSFRPTRAT